MPAETLYTKNLNTNLSTLPFSELRETRAQLERAYGLKYAKYSESVEGFVQNSYPNSIHLIERISPKSRELLYNFLYHTVDQGLLKEYTFNDTRSGEFFAEEVAMLNRSAFCNKVIRTCLDKTGEYNHTPVTFLALDIKNLRGADLYHDKEGNKFADILLNTVANNIQKSIEQIKTTYNTQNIDVNVGRYGGDEFFISITGTNDVEIINGIKDYVYKSITDVDGYYSDGEKINKEKVGIKNDTIVEIDIPDNLNAVSQKIFFHYLKRGLIFDQGQLDKILSRFTDTKGVLNVNDLNTYLGGEDRAYSIYPPQIQTIEMIRGQSITSQEKLKELYKLAMRQNENVTSEEKAHLQGFLYDLTKAFTSDENGESNGQFNIVFDNIIKKLKINTFISKDPNIWLMLVKAHKADKKNNNKTSSCDELLSVVEDIVYDPLLREPMMTFTEFFDRTQIGNYDAVYGYDLKFIKEINDTLSLVDGDIAIRDLWSKIKDTIPQEDQNKFEFGRRGGTFFLGLKKGQTVSNETNIALKTIKKVRILSDFVKPNGIEVPIGYIKLDTSLNNMETTTETIKKQFNTFFRLLDETWMNQIMSVLKNFQNNELNQISLTSLTSQYFTGKRTAERVGKFEKHIQYKKTIIEREC